MSYYEPSSLYGLGPGDLGELREKTRWDSGVHVDQDYWSLLGPCQVDTILEHCIRDVIHHNIRRSGKDPLIINLIETVGCIASNFFHRK